jgi:GNAT superfamily N-acetyltransferase
VLLRPIKPEDGTQHIEFFNALDPTDIHFRVFMQMRELQRPQLARLTQIDYDREMAFIATWERDPGRFETLGVARAIADPDNNSAEFAIIVRSDLKGQGLGPILLGKLITYCRRRGTREIVGEALADNHRMMHLVRQFGGSITHSDPGTMRFRFDLAS